MSKTLKPGTPAPKSGQYLKLALRLPESKANHCRRHLIQAKDMFWQIRQSINAK
jgi:hypothetical protein